jgi:hypothetical protein
MPPILDARRENVTAHWGELVNELRKILPRRGGHYAVKSEAVAGLSAVLWCNGFPTEIAQREIGGTIPVVPLLEVGLASGSDAERWWLSWGERWTTGKRSKLEFDASNLAVFWDDPTDERIQMFRAEWSGVKRTATSAEFTGGNAGHPHWQFDALRIHCRQLSDRMAGWRAERALASLVNAAPDAAEPIDFAPERELELGIWNGRELDWCGIHFASNAAWANVPWIGGSPTPGHAHAPIDVIELRNWVTSTVRYIAYEVAKFV